MRKSRFSEAQIIEILKQADAGVKVADLCRKAVRHVIEAHVCFERRA